MQTLLTVIIIIIFISIGTFLFRFFYNFFEKIHSRYDDQLQKGFCDKCLIETLPDSCGDVSSYYFIGSSLAYIGERCDVCNSYIVEHRKVFLGINIKKNNRYRIITVGKKITMSPMHREREFISRRLKES
ncbi:MAG: hypothetical protein Q8M94_15005 [Ignavibacteria bacterium]|nr:hypothetical protein [Ignavibacteria bacterium]